jgi:Protein of unknown function (DUF1761)
MLDFSNLNYLAIFITTLITFGIGAVWYTALFGKVWQKETGLTDKQIAEGSPAKTYGGSFVCFFLLNVFLAALFKDLQPKDWIAGAVTGFQIGILVNLATLSINYLYQYKSFKLWLIDGGYYVLLMVVGGAILAVWK